ncbi:hypothetical protein ACOME3_003676 [Neoechinorhynchus agilis]
MADPNSVPCAKGSCSCTARVDNKIVLITGGNSGIGFETGKALLAKGCKLILACRNEQKVKSAIELLKGEFPQSDIQYVLMDLSSLDSVRQCAAQVNRQFERIDILLNNAGALVNPELTKDGFDVHFQTNHLGHFLFTNLILDLVKKSQQGRIINVSSLAHKMGKADWDRMTNIKKRAWFAYSNAKLYNILFTKGLAKRLEGTNVTVNALHPGLVKTGFAGTLTSSSNMWTFANKILVPLFKSYVKNPTEGAQTSIHCAICPELKRVTGKYFSDCKMTSSSCASNCEQNIEKLWKVSAEYCELNAHLNKL